MVKINLIKNDEINLISLFKIIYISKLKILLITIISFLIGYGYSSQLPNSYLNSLVISLNDNAKFHRLNFIYLLLEDDQNNMDNLTYQSRIEYNRTTELNSQNQINKIILNRYINELKDYEELLFNIKNSKIYRENISKLPTKNQEKELFKYAKKLKIVEPKKNNTNYELNFEWNNAREAKEILKNTLNLTLNNLEKSIFEEIELKFNLKKKLIQTYDMVRIEYLKEQSSIAKELDISDNKSTIIGSYQSNMSLDFNIFEIAYYLRGYKAIDKEIELIKKRDNQELKLIEQEINLLKKDNNNWINYNINLIDVTSKKNNKLIFLISILLGIIVGVLYSLVHNQLQTKTIFKN